MSNTLFSSLVYRIIGEPEKWQEASVEKMHSLLDEVASLELPENLLELELGNQILERISGNDHVLSAFQSFLENSRYGLVICDDDFHAIYHNKKAQPHMQYLMCANNNDKLSDNLTGAITQHKNTQIGDIFQLNIDNPKIGNIYARINQTHHLESGQSNKFLVLFIPISDDHTFVLHQELVKQYRLTQKEQSVVCSILTGKSIKQIADNHFVSQNTVKSQLKSIYTKTGTNSQTALSNLFLNHEAQQLESYFELKIPGKTPLVDTHSLDLYVRLGHPLQICYREYGPASGRPLIVLHNSYACRHHIRPDFTEVLERTNRRIIIPDRPGYGNTPFIKEYPENWNALLAEFADQLELESFDLLGNILSSTLALNYAKQNDPRLNSIILTSPVYINHSDQRQFLGEVLFPASRLINTSKRIAAEIYKLWLKSMLTNTDKHIHHMMSSSLGDQEKYLLDSDWLLPTVCRNFNEAMSESLKGSTADLITALTPQNVDLSKFQTPVTIWTGSDDKMISSQGSLKILDALPNKTIHQREGYGQDIYYSLFEEIIA